jgi:hypothetical protein
MEVTVPPRRYSRGPMEEREDRKEREGKRGKIKE